MIKYGKMSATKPGACLCSTKLALRVKVLGVIVAALCGLEVLCQCSSVLDILSYL
jgi:hypothetical protein